ncbi:hypothetical protein ABFS83_13G054500 [Erythranthe nasuta]
MANFSTANETNFSNQQSYDDLNEVELLEYIDSCSLLVMSLLEQDDDDSKVEDIIIHGSDDQRFDIVDQEYSCSSDETCSTSSDEYSEDSLFSDVEQLMECYSTSPDDQGFEWMDTEMNYFVDNNHFTDEIETANMVIDYSNVCYYGTMPVEEEVDYIDLWQ